MCLPASRFNEIVRQSKRVRVCVTEDPKINALLDLFEGKYCGTIQQEKLMRGADLAFDSEGHPITFSGLPDLGLPGLGLTFDHPNDHPTPDTTPAVTMPKNIYTKPPPTLAEQIIQAGQKKKNGTRFASNRTHEHDELKFASCVPNPCKNGTKCELSDDLKSFKCVKVVINKSTSGMYDYMGRDIFDLAHGLIGAPLTDKQLADINMPPEMSKEDEAVCVGTLGPLQMLREGCALFFKIRVRRKRVLSHVKLPCESLNTLLTTLLRSPSAWL